MTADLLLRAAHCYVRAGWVDDAGRCFEGADHPLEAARLYEQRQRWAPAAQAYARAAEWEAAGHCYLRAEEPESAADCLLRAGQKLEAAWILAQELHHFRRAYDLADAVHVADPGHDDARNREMVLARCEAGLGQPRDAARRLRGVLEGLAVLQPGGRRRVELRALAIADSLGRPDLRALIHAAASRAGIPGAFDRWQAWAVTTLGDASGLPIEDPAQTEQPPRDTETSGQRSQDPASAKTPETPSDE